MLIITAQLCLAFLNLLLEAKKWQVLISPLLKTKLHSAFKMILSGCTSGIFTPGKLGEPVGRVMTLERELWAKATILNYLGGMMTSLVIVGFGLPSLVVNWSFLFQNTDPQYKLFLTASALLTLSIWFAWSKRSWLKRVLINARSFGSSAEELIGFVKTVPAKIWRIAIFWSFLRFAVYSLQLGVFLWFLGAQLEIIRWGIVFIYFLMISALPSFFLSDLGVRGSVALFVFSFSGLSDLSIVTAVGFLWLINQVVPALIGTAFIMRR